MKTLTIPSVLKDAALLAVLCAAVYTALLYTPRTTKITQSLGSYTFMQDGSSFSLYANGSEKYFLFTSKEKPDTDIEAHPLRDLYNHINRYIFHNNMKQKIIRNTMTITYGRDAIVIEGTNNLITENPEPIRSLLEQEIGNALVPNSPEIRELSISTTGFILVHSDVPGLVRVTLPSQNRVIINKDKRTITIQGEIHVDVRPTYPQI